MSISVTYLQKGAVMKTDHTFTIDITRDTDGIWTARCEELHLYADGESYEELLKIAEDIAIDMAVELGFVKDGQTMSLQFLQIQNLAIAA